MIDKTKERIYFLSLYFYQLKIRLYTIIVR
nr:MAG TPA: hypothetical protein [Caudoviricetes sp.]